MRRIDRHIDVRGEYRDQKSDQTDPRGSSQRRNQQTDRAAQFGNSAD